MRPKSSPWKNLRSVYERKGIVLVLGAGVSLGSGIPEWETLLAKFAGRTKTEKHVFEQLRSRGFSLAAIAGALAQLYNSRETFISNVREVLYADFPFNRSHGPHSPPGFVAHTKNNNPTLRAVAAMCCRQMNQDYQSNQRIKCVVSFNLDSLLEAFTESNYGRAILRPVEHSAISTAAQLISVYHLHGYLPFWNLEKAQPAYGNVVLTEYDYFDFFGNPLGAFNYTFLYLLREHSCVFIGLSMRDDNLRRLLHYSARERRSTLSALAPGMRADEAIKRHYAVLLREDDKMDEVIQRGLGTIGVRTLWLDDHAQLSDHLAYVYEVEGCSWDSVF